MEQPISELSDSILIFTVVAATRDNWKHISLKHFTSIWVGTL